MRNLKPFERPVILREIPLEPVSPILDASVVDKATVRTMGQEVEEHDISDDSFNHDWQ